MRYPGILIVEDQPEMADVLREGLEADCYRVTVANDGEEALRAACAQTFEAIVLDVMLPLRDGFSVATELRRTGNKTPILMLTARDSVGDKVLGLDCGVEDYLTKPFSFLELSARMRALIRRGQPPQTSWGVGDLVLDSATHYVARAARAIRLTKTEFLVLEVLLRNAGHVVTRAELLKAAWGSAAVEDNNLDVTISALRAKVDRGKASRLIQTVRGFGYRITVDE